MAKAKDRSSNASAQQRRGEKEKSPTSIDKPAEHTPGPWHWELRPGLREVSLSSHRLVVMSFVRWGMDRAAPEFRDGKNLLERVEKFGEPIPGREHHEWEKQINHPDARLIAAAPELLAACEATADALRQWSKQDDSLDAHILMANAAQLIGAAIAKARSGKAVTP